MKLNEYEIGIAEFDKYPDYAKPSVYFLGLGGEFGEADEKIKTLHPNDEIIKELGDVLWYLTRICSEFGFSIVEIYDWMETPKEKTMSGAIGSVLEYQKKIIRDKEGKKEERPSILKNRLISVLYHIQKTGLEFNASLEDITVVNYKKLESRHKRGVVGGSGDNR